MAFSAALVLALAFSEPSTTAVELRWRAPEGCPDPAVVRARLDDYLRAGSSHGSAVAATQVDADVSVDDHDEWTVELRFHGRDAAPRVLHDTTCDGLVSAAVVVIAIAVAPPPGPPPSTTRDHPPPDREPPPRPQPSRRGAGAGRRADPVGLFVAALAGVGLGAVPFGAVVSPVVGVARARWRVALGATIQPRRRLRVDALPQVGSDVRHWALGVDGCWLAPAHRVVAIPLCGGVEAGEVIASPVGLDRGVVRRRAWVAGLVTAALRVRVHPRVALWLAPTAVFAVTPTGVVAGTLRLYRAPPVGVRAQAGVEVRIW